METVLSTFSPIPTHKLSGSCFKNKERHCSAVKNSPMSIVLYERPLGTAKNHLRNDSGFVVSRTGMFSFEMGRFRTRMIWQRLPNMAPFTARSLNCHPSLRLLNNNNKIVRYMCCKKSHTDKVAAGTKGAFVKKNSKTEHHHKVWKTKIVL